MKKSALVAALVALGVTLAQADISIPLGASDFATTAADAAAVKALYGTSAFPNAENGSYGADAVTMTAGSGSLKLSVPFASIEDPADDYSANTGVIQPITASWDVKDMTGLTAITFDVKISSGKLKQFKVALNSDAYTQSELNAGTTLIAQSLADGVVAPAKIFTFSKTNTGWQTITLTPTNFGYSKWNESNPAVTWADAIKKLKAIQFSPETDYDNNGVGANGGIVTMEIRNVTLKGVDAVPLVKGAGCTGAAVSLADASVSASKQNSQGGYWYGFTDTSNVPKENDSAVGTSEWNADPLFDETGFHFGADLNKTVSGTWHPYAGWAAIGTGFKLDGSDAYIQLPNLKAVEFTISGATLSPLVDGVNFKVELNGVSNDATHQVMIPSRQLGTAATKICVDVARLAQPGWHKDLGNTDFDPSTGVGKLSWEVKIADQKNNTITAAAGQKFTVDKVNLYGATEEELVGIFGSSKLGRSAFVASYLNGQIKVSGLDGFTAVDVVTLSGAKVASFAPSAVANVKLERGTYLLVARGANKTLVRSLPVLF